MLKQENKPSFLQRFRDFIYRHWLSLTGSAVVTTAIAVTPSEDNQANKSKGGTSSAPTEMVVENNSQTAENLRNAITDVNLSSFEDEAAYDDGDDPAGIYDVGNPDENSTQADGVSYNPDEEEDPAGVYDVGYDPDEEQVANEGAQESPTSDSPTSETEAEISEETAPQSADAELGQASTSDTSDATQVKEGENGDESQQAEEAIKLPPITLDSAVVQAAGLSLYNQTKAMTELNEGKRLYFYILNDVVHVGIGYNAEMDPLNIRKTGNLKILLASENNRELSAKEVKDFFATFTTKTAEQLANYTISDAEAYRLLQGSYTLIYKKVAEFFSESGVDFTKLPKAVQAAVCDTVLRVGPQKFKDTFPKAQRKIIDLSQRSYEDDPEGYKKAYMDTIAELRIQYKNNEFSDTTSAQRAYRIDRIATATLLINQGLTPTQVMQHLAENPVPGDPYLGISTNVIEQRAAATLVAKWLDPENHTTLYQVWRTQKDEVAKRAKTDKKESKTESSEAAPTPASTNVTTAALTSAIQRRDR